MADATNANVSKLSLYQDGMTTAASNKWGNLELESRTNSNAVADILNATWSSWTPTVTYVATGPSNIGATGSTTVVAYYKQIGSTVLFNCQIVAWAQSGINCNSTKISLPVTARDINAYPIIRSIMLSSGATYVDPVAYIDQTSDASAGRLICFREHYKLIATNPYQMYVSGAYEAE